MDSNTNTRSTTIQWLIHNPEQIKFRETYASKRAWADDMARIYANECATKQRIAKVKSKK